MDEIKDPDRYRYLFFDVDGTLTRSRTKIEDDLFRLLQETPHDIVITSGQRTEDIYEQVNRLPCVRMGQNGNHAVAVDGTELWNEPLTKQQEEEIFDHIELLQRNICITVKDKNDLVEHRGAQLCYSFIGHHEETGKKERWDPDRKKRESFLNQFPFESDAVELRIGGTTTFDYFPRGKHKGSNIKRLLSLYSWVPEECIYFGDRLHPGGNDEAVIGVIDTVHVDDPLHTHEILKEYFF